MSATPPPSLPIFNLPPVATPVISPTLVAARPVPWREWDEAVAVAGSGAALISDDEITFRPLAASGCLAALLWLRLAPVGEPLAFIASADAPAPLLIGALRTASDVLTGRENVVRTAYGPDHLITLFVPLREDE